MLVSELKNEIKNYNKKELENIIIELYKRLPKSKKEDYNIDEFIKNINDVDKKVIKKNLSFEDLQKEILYFLNCVDNEYYVVPNRIISKKERSSWRFKVKKYYKELTNILPNSEDGGFATFLLIEIFKRLSIGSNRLLFINWETFRALGVPQDEYYDVIIKRILYNGYTNDNLQNCINLLDIVKDPYELSYNMFSIFVSNLKTTDNKEFSIQILNDKVNHLITELKNTNDWHKQFELKEMINNYVECITDIYFILHEEKNGIEYFHKHYIEDNEEIKEYVLLGKLEDANLINMWLTEYEKNIGKINFRHSLKEKYNNLKKNMM